MLFDYYLYGSLQEMEDGIVAKQCHSDAIMALHAGTINGSGQVPDGIPSQAPAERHAPCPKNCARQGRASAGGRRR